MTNVSPQYTHSLFVCNSVLQTVAAVDAGPGIVVCGCKVV